MLEDSTARPMFLLIIVICAVCCTATFVHCRGSKIKIDCIKVIKLVLVCFNSKELVQVCNQIFWRVHTTSQQWMMIPQVVFLDLETFSKIDFHVYDLSYKN